MMKLLMTLMNLLFLLKGLLDSVRPLLATHLVNMYSSLTGENLSATKRLWRISTRKNGLQQWMMR